MMSTNVDIFDHIFKTCFSQTDGSDKRLYAEECGRAVRAKLSLLPLNTVCLRFKVKRRSHFSALRFYK